MAAFVPSSLTSITLEDALVEIAFRVQATESDVSKNPNATDNVQVSVGTNGSINISASMPATITIDTAGHPVLNATEYLT
jgi:hypothetical protein